MAKSTIRSCLCCCLDGCHILQSKEEGHIVNKAVYCLLGFNQHGSRELLGMYIGKTEHSFY